MSIAYNLVMAKAKEEKQEIIWDKKRIAIFLVSAFLFLALIFELKTLILGKSATDIKPKVKTEKSVEGASTENLPDLRQSIQNQIGNIRDEAQSINVVDVATSSPEIQKIINDLKSVKDLPKNQVKSTCEKICGNL